MNRLAPIKDFIIFLLKGDFAVLAGFGTLLTVLGIGGGEAVRVLDRTSLAVLGVLVAAGFGAVILWLVVSEMARDPRERRPYVVWGLGFTALILHLGAYGFGVVEGGRILARQRAALKMEAAEKRVGRFVRDWVRRKENVPPSDSLSATPAGEGILDWLGTPRAPDTLIYVREDKWKYSIRTPGADGLIRTSDDKVVGVDYAPYGSSPENLREFMRTLRKEMRKRVTE